MNPPNSATVDDGRPAGGTARTSGTKTPRKVQWAFDEEHPVPSASSTHALDEHGLDPNAFETLTDALERHRSSSSSLPLRPLHRVSEPPPRIRITDPIPIANPNNPYLNPHRFTAAPLSSQPLSATTPTTGTNTTTNSSPGSPTENASPGSPGYLVPGENYIDPGEHDGLPGTTNLEGYSREQAKNVVRAHTRSKRSWGGWFNPGRGERPADKKKSKGKSHRHHDSTSDNEKDRDTDIEASAYDSMSNNPRRMGGGVLSALLTLYDHQNQSQSTFSTTTTARSSMDMSDYHGNGNSSRARADAPVDPPAKPWLHPRRQQAPKPPPDPDSRPSSPPAGSRLVPPGAAAKRPGYMLSRFSLESNLPTRKTINPLPTIRRPSSMTFDRAASAPGTPSSPDSGSRTPDLRRDSMGGTTAAGSSVGHGAGGKHKWTGMLKDLKHANPSFHSLKSFGSNFGVAKSTASSEAGTPTTEGDDWDEKWMSRERDREREKRRKEEKRRKKKTEAYITRHVAEIIQRQEFILKLTRALMMFGGPSHRMQAQIQATARVLGIDLSCMYLPDVMLISFDDGQTGTSSIKFIRQGSALDLGKLYDAFKLYWKVIHDKLSVSEASAELDALMRRKPLYNFWQLVFFGGMCSASICSIGFNGSFIDSLIVMPMGCLLVAIQLLSVRNELYSNVFEITIATLLSFLSASLAGTHRFCYSALASSSVVLILPGFLVTVGALELSSRSIVSGAVRLCFAAVYSLFLGFGLAIGAQIYQKGFSKSIVGFEDYTCRDNHDPDGPWWQQTPSLWWAFLTVPIFPLFLSMRNQAPWNKKELFFSIIIACIGWVTNHFTSTKFINQNDISAACGAFAVGLVSNIYGRFFGGNAFVVMITGILFQVPSGLANGGLLTFANDQNNGKPDSYLSGFQTALQLISVAIGLTVGLSISLVVVHPIQSRRRAAGIFSL